jgi:hypothetical protein
VEGEEREKRKRTNKMIEQRGQKCYWNPDPSPSRWDSQGEQAEGGVARAFRREKTIKNCSLLQETTTLQWEVLQGVGITGGRSRNKAARGQGGKGEPESWGPGGASGGNKEGGGQEGEQEIWTDR